jgi:hypothetical protein
MIKATISTVKLGEKSLQNTEIAAPIVRKKKSI